MLRRSQHPDRRPERGFSYQSSEEGVSYPCPLRAGRANCSTPLCSQYITHRTEVRAQVVQLELDTPPVSLTQQLVQCRRAMHDVQQLATDLPSLRLLFNKGRGKDKIILPDKYLDYHYSMIPIISRTKGIDQLSTLVAKGQGSCSIFPP